MSCVHSDPCPALLSACVYCFLSPCTDLEDVSRPCHRAICTRLLVIILFNTHVPPVASPLSIRTRPPAGAISFHHASERQGGPLGPESGSRSLFIHVLRLWKGRPCPLGSGDTPFLGVPGRWARTISTCSLPGTLVGREGAAANKREETPLPPWGVSGETGHQYDKSVKHSAWVSGGRPGENQGRKGGGMGRSHRRWENTSGEGDTALAPGGRP